MSDTLRQWFKDWGIGTTHKVADDRLLALEAAANQQTEAAVAAALEQAAQWAKLEAQESRRKARDPKCENYGYYSARCCYMEELALELKTLIPQPARAALDALKGQWLKTLYADPSHQLFGVALSDLQAILNTFEEHNAPITAKGLERMQASVAAFKEQAAKAMCSLCRDDPWGKGRAVAKGHAYFKDGEVFHPTIEPLMEHGHPCFSVPVLALPTDKADSALERQLQQARLGEHDKCCPECAVRPPESEMELFWRRSACEQRADLKAAIARTPSTEEQR